VDESRGAKIVEVFEILHDGRITRFEAQGEVLVLRVEIQYLAQRIAATHRGFTLRLSGVKDVSFEPWPNGALRALPVMTDYQAIFEPTLDILGAEAAGEGLRITCNQAAPAYPYCGGELRLRAERVEVFDDASAECSLEVLRDLAAGYWDEWSKARPK